VIDIERDSWTAGGAANVAINIASLGAQCTVCGFIGKDADGARLRGVLRERGVDALPTPGEGMTVVKTRVMVRHQQLCRLDRESPPQAYAVAPAKAGRLLGRAVKACDAVVFSDYAKGLLDDALVSHVAALARAERKFVALDPKPKHRLSFSGLDLITPNKREALQLAGIEPGPGAAFPAAAVCARLDERFGTKNVVVTLGEDGMLLSAGGRVIKTIPTSAREVYDVSGAGDTALAGLVLALTSGAGLEEAAHFANAAAGVVVAKLGTATVSPEELLDHVSRAP
jgi:D-beta-D-heptose 7-phosphate kinase/D-beta-D-heptose 1-phosphate adenosyltransferase